MTVINIVFAKILIFLICYMFTSLLTFDTLGASIWEKRQKMIELYVKKYITKPVTRLISI